MKQGVEVYDIETFINCFTYTGMDVETKQIKQFVIWKHLNQYDDLMEHIGKLKGMIGYNNLAFDYPVLHYMMNTDFYGCDAQEIAEAVYEEAQRLIKEEFSAIREQYVKIPQLDLMKIWHYDNTAKMTSLKKLQVAMRYKNVQDMPLEHFENVETLEEVQNILDYNLNDVDSTYEFLKLTKKKLDLRKGVLKRYGVQCLNYSDTKMGEELMLKLYCEATGEEMKDTRKLRTPRNLFKFKECIPDYIQFSTKDFNDLKEYLQGVRVTELKDSFKYSFEYRGFTFDLGSGGIHGCIKSGVYESDDEWIIVDADVGSLYPSLGITLGLFPAHLSAAFPVIYKEAIVDPRLKAKKEGDMVMADGFKLAANSVYGKSNSKYSWLFDPLYTIKTTLGGQLGLCLLSEMLFEALSEMVMLQINTDGLTVRIKRSSLDRYYEVCKEWEERTALGLEYVEYSKMIIRDVNTYTAIKMNGGVKRKGAMCTYEDLINADEYHKAFNQLIVPYAISEYFVKGLPVEETIKNGTNIFDYCKTYNRTKGFVCYTTDENGVGKEYQSKTNRYFISKKGKVFTKEKEGKVSNIEANGLVTIYNNSQEGTDISDYAIDYDYYIAEAYKIIHVIDGTLERQKEEARKAKEQAKLDKEEENYLKMCINKVPTEIQFERHKRDWLIEKYGRPLEIKPSKIKTKKD